MTRVAAAGGFGTGKRRRDFRFGGYFWRGGALRRRRPLGGFCEGRRLVRLPLLLLLLLGRLPGLDLLPAELEVR